MAGRRFFCAEPRYYWRLGFVNNHYRFFRNPHPLLCSNKGVINRFPDHPHEGKIVIGNDLTQFAQPMRDGFRSREFPDLVSSPLAPQVIAWARVQPDHKITDFKGEVTPKEFDCVGAYNGHRVDVGRVVTDSTWHHWFDVNLTGRMEFNSDAVGNIETGDPSKQYGFKAAASGRAHLAKIKNYFHNVAMDALERLVGRCKARLWISHLVPAKLLAEIAVENPLDHFGVAEAGRAELEVYVTGGIVQLMMEHGAKTRKPPSDEQLEALVKRGAKQGLKASLREAERVERSLAELREISNRAL